MNTRRFHFHQILLPDFIYPEIISLTQTVQKKANYWWHWHVAAGYIFHKLNPIYSSELQHIHNQRKGLQKCTEASYKKLTRKMKAKILEVQILRTEIDGQVGAWPTSCCIRHTLCWLYQPDATEWIWETIWKMRRHCKENEYDVTQRSVGKINVMNRPKKLAQLWAETHRTVSVQKVMQSLCDHSARSTKG